MRSEAAEAVKAIRIELDDPADAADLVRAFAVRGLTAGISGADGRELEIVYRHERTERLLVDVLAALEAWLADRARPSARIVVGERSYDFETAAGGHGRPAAHARAA